MVLGHPEDRQRGLELGAAGRGEGSPLPRSGLRVGRFAAGGGHADDPVPGVGELGQQPTREVGLVVGVRPDPEDGAEGRDGAHDRIVACDRCHRPVIGDGTGGHAATVPRQRRPGSSSPTGTTPVPTTKGTPMTTQLEAPALDLARVEEFAYEVAGHAARPTTASSSTSATGSASGRPSPPSTPPPARSSRSAPGSRSATCASGCRRRPPPATSPTTRRPRPSRCRPSTRWCSPTTTARPPAPAPSRSSRPSTSRRTGWPTRTRPARAWAGTSTTRACSAAWTASSAPSTATR